MAIDDLFDEHEQSERVRSWLRKYGAGLIGGIALGIAVIFGWQWWQQAQAQKQQLAHARYTATQSTLLGSDLKNAAAETAKLKDGPEIYAEMASLQLAHSQAQAGEIDAAIATLRGMTPDASLRLLVDQRLARLLVDSGKTDEALKLLGEANDSASLEIRADASLVAGKVEQARELYLKALTGMDIASPQHGLLELKLMGAGGTVPEPAEPI